MMDMDWGTLGTGGGAGFVAAILTLLGWNRRITKLEEDKLDKSEFEAKHDAVTQVQVIIREDLKRVETKIDTLISKLVPGGPR